MQSPKNYKRIVVKIGASLLFAKPGQPDCFVYPMEELSRQIGQLIEDKKEIIIVSSGAVAAGMHLMKMKQRPKELASLQAAASVGQHFLMSQYQRFFEKRGLNCAQILLTYDDLSDRKRYLNAKNTISTLLSRGIVPVVNENDTISTDEIKFGDNDKLSALVAKLINANLLIILSDVEGLWDKDKNIIRVVDKITPEIRSLACPTEKQSCVGGMVTKIDAAAMAVRSGIPCIVANGHKKDIIKSVVNDVKSNGTLFLPKGEALDAKEHWMAYGTKSRGKILVDDGAKKALLNKKSLLSVGIVSCSGNFAGGDIVSICDQRDVEFARGKAGLAVKELEKVQGGRFSKEIIHRDNIVIL
ncbi:MAG: glutamate 5-kinase [Candidatus Omnitrophota bacterium]